MPDIKLTKHIGQLKNTSSRIIVVFMSLPEDPNFALIISTDHLPPMLQDELKELINKPDCQQETNLANYFARKTFRNVSGTNESVLQWLHSKGVLKKEPVSNIIMTPHPSVKEPLENILKNMETQKADLPLSNSKKFQPMPIIEEAPAVAIDPTQQASSFVLRGTSSKPEDTKAIANNLLFEAKMLRVDADSAAAAKEKQAAELLESIGEKIVKTEVKEKAKRTKKTA